MPGAQSSSTFTDVVLPQAGTQPQPCEQGQTGATCIQPSEHCRPGASRLCQSCPTVPLQDSSLQKVVLMDGGSEAALLHPALGLSLHPGIGFFPEGRQPP